MRAAPADGGQGLVLAHILHHGELVYLQLFGGHCQDGTINSLVGFEVEIGGFGQVGANGVQHGARAFWAVTVVVATGQDGTEDGFFQFGGVWWQTAEGNGGEVLFFGADSGQ